MEEGVSPSLPRNGFSFYSDLGFSGSLFVSMSVSVTVYGGSNFPDATHRTSFYLAISVSSTRKPVPNRDAVYSDDRAWKVISSTDYGDLSSYRQGLLQQSLVLLRSDNKVHPKTSTPLRSGSVQTIMGMGRGVARITLPSGEVDSNDTADDFIAGSSDSGSGFPIFADCLRQGAEVQIWRRRRRQDGGAFFSFGGDGDGRMVALFLANAGLVFGRNLRVWRRRMGPRSCGSLDRSLVL